MQSGTPASFDPIPGMMAPRDMVERYWGLASTTEPSSRRKLTKQEHGAEGAAKLIIVATVTQR
jgi:hypothetical protein